MRQEACHAQLVSSLMGWPEDQATGLSGPANGNGTYYDDSTSHSKDTAYSATDRSKPTRQTYGSMEALGSHDRPERQLDPNSEADPRQRSKRRPSGQQRTCGKCQKHLTGQFVRALGDTYHLECFTCNVSLFMVQSGRNRTS